MNVADTATRARPLDAPSCADVAAPVSGIGRVVLHTRVVTHSGGGPDKTILNSPRFLEPFGYHTICAYMHPPADSGMDALQHRAAELGARLEGIDDRGPFDWRVVRDLLRLCRRERVTIWHAHDYKSNALGLLLRRFWPMRLVTTVHGWVHFTLKTPLYYAIDRMCLRGYERVVCVSEDLLDQCLTAGVRRDRCRHIENAIDIDQFSRRQHRDEAKRRLGVAPGVFLVGAVGRLSAEKGFDVLIRAFHKLLASGVDSELCILGEGPERGALDRLIAQLGLKHRIRLEGYQPNTISWYHAMDAYALSSYREGLPNVVLEAMAMEVPVVATRIAGVPRVVADGVNGMLVEPGDVGALRQALQTMAGDASLRARMAKEGRNTMERNYSFAVRMEKIRSIYDELLD